MKLGFITKGEVWRSMPIYFNLSHPVGKGYPNAAVDDVGFVQFCFAAIASSTVLPIPPNLKVPWSKVRVTGHMDQVTQDGIDAWQQDRRARFGVLVEVDGIFSVAPQAAASYGSDTPYSIVSINGVLMVSTPSIWPRLDKHPLVAMMAEPIRKAISPQLTA
jgi:hypothetical protein